MKRTFTREEMNALDLPDGGVAPGADNPHGHAIVHSREFFDDRRWVDTWQLVFQIPGDDALYRVYYDVGATEAQEDADPWNDEDEIEAETVEPVPGGVTTYLNTACTLVQAPRFQIFRAWWDGYDSWGIDYYFTDEKYAKEVVASSYLEEEWSLSRSGEIEEAIRLHISWEKTGTATEPVFHLLDKGSRTGVEIITTTVYGRATPKELGEYEARCTAEGITPAPRRGRV